MFYEIKMPNMDQKIMAFINNEFLSVVGKYVDDYDIELRVQKYIDKKIDKSIAAALKDHESLSMIQSNKKPRAKFIIKKPELLEKLDDRQKFILKHRDGNSETILSFADIAYKLDISPERTRQLQANALRRLTNQNRIINGADASPAFEYI
jgi:DNA-directed RNA polymerase sigma subunit (sigma70/sigma32)